MFFFFNDTATTEIYTLSLHDALPISPCSSSWCSTVSSSPPSRGSSSRASCSAPTRSEEHTSELQSQSNLVCRLLLEKKKTNEPSVPSLPPTYTQPWHLRMQRKAITDM